MLLCNFRRNADVIENRSEVIERFSENLIAWEGDDQVAAIFAYADACWIDECCVAGVAVFVFHFEPFLFVSGFGPKPLSRERLERGEVKTADSQARLSRSN